MRTKSTAWIPRSRSPGPAGGRWAELFRICERGRPKFALISDDRGNPMCLDDEKLANPHR
jgi:hypothetical protein